MAVLGTILAFLFVTETDDPVNAATLFASGLERAVAETVAKASSGPPAGGNGC